MSNPKPKASETWHIVQDTVSNKLIYFLPSEEPSILKDKRYIDIGQFQTKDDVELFVACKQIQLRPDAIEYLRCEHSVHELLQKGTSINNDDLTYMLRLARIQTGHKCLGTCRSLDGCPPCRICHANLHDTWQMCAYIRAIHQA